MNTVIDPPTWQLRPVADATAAGCGLVRQWLREFNWTENADFMRKLDEPAHASHPLILLASSDGSTIGGLFAETQLSWLRITLTAVHPGWRRRGLGKALLEEAERQAAQRGCRRVHADSMSYQAPGFYLKNGYQVAGELPDWDSHGHSKFHFIKTLPQPAAP